MWQQVGLPVKTAGDSGADTTEKRILRQEGLPSPGRFGYEYLKT